MRGYKIKIWDDFGKPIGEVTEKKPKELKKIMDNWFKKIS